MNETQHIGLELIDPNPWQTRQNEDPAHVDEIAHSIKAMGMMQTPTARQVGDRYQLVFGHTRLAAYKLLETLGQDGYSYFPLVIHDLDDEQMAVAAYEENEKRRDLNPVEKAKAVQKMLADFSWTQEQLAEKLHIDRSGISNMLRMLRLPADLLNSIATGIVPVRSAMSLLPVYELSGADQVRLNDQFGDTVTEFMSVATHGEINSDSIRKVVDGWMNFLHPQPEQLLLVDEPVVIENDTITAPEEPGFVATPGQFMPPPPSGLHATQAHIDEWLNNPNNEGEDNGSESGFREPEIETSETGEGTDLESQNQVVEEQATSLQTQPQPTEDHPVEKPAPAELKKDPEDPNAIYLSVAWKTNGVTVSLLKPGWPAPKFRFRNMLKVEMLPEVIREMEHS